MRYLYHGSATQNLCILKPRKRYTPKGINFSAIYATPSRGFASAHAFPWGTTEGFDLSINTKNKKITFTIPKRFRKRLAIPISLYRISSIGFKKTEEETTGYTWHIKKSVPILKEEKYESVEKALKKLKVKVKYK